MRGGLQKVRLREEALRWLHYTFYMRLLRFPVRESFRAQDVIFVLCDEDSCENVYALVTDALRVFLASPVRGDSTYFPVRPRLLLEGLFSRLSACVGRDAAHVIFSFAWGREERFAAARWVLRDARFLARSHVPTQQWVKGGGALWGAPLIYSLWEEAKVTRDYSICFIYTALPKQTFL